MREGALRSAITSRALAAPGIAHAFFTRQGGVSGGLYASLNGGVGSRDDPAAVAENRRRMAAHLGVAPERFLVPYQVHSAAALAVAAPWAPEARPRVDALVTDVAGLALGVTGADCGIVLFAEPAARVIGAAHAGWRGALSGVLEATVAAMEGLGAARGAIVAVLGPTIAAASYEVGPEFVARFVEADAGNGRHFAPSGGDDRALFDLPGYVTARLRGTEIGKVENLRQDTYADEARFFSYRRSLHRKEADYGRLVAAIALRAAEPRARTSLRPVMQTRQ